MAGMSFEDFARGFRERTTQRLIEFENTLARAQEDVERAAQQARQKAVQQSAQKREHESYQSAAQTMAGNRAQGFGHANAPTRHNAQGQVRSVLRREI